MNKKMFTLLLTISLFSTQTALAWNNTGHELVARIAWDDMTDTTRQNVVKLLLRAPNNACLKQLFQNDSRPLAVRQREFFVVSATWPDIVRPKDQNDHRICTKYHRRDWHFVDFFWKGTSGDPNDPPTDLPSMPIASTNAMERLEELETLVVSNQPAKERALFLGWILHLVGDIHQPLHTSGRVTTFPAENDGDAGGNDFKLGSTTLHSYWDGIVDRAHPRKPNETFPMYLERVAGEFKASHPRSQFNIQPGEYDKWIHESLERAKAKAYPKTLQRGQLPNMTYRTSTFEVASEAIPEAGYRLADLLNELFGT